MSISQLLLDFRVTSRCNLACDLCFRNPGIDDKPIEEIKEVITRMYQYGFRRIGFTGGEPTLRADYTEMISFAKGLGFLTYLSTVGHKFIEDLNQLDGILDWVGLPIDGIDYETNAEIRSKAMGSQHQTIESIFTWLAEHPTSIKIKLTTVVSRANIDDLDLLVSFVAGLPYTFESWRFYQFCPLGAGKDKRDKLEIPTDEFLEKLTALQKKFNEPKISWATFEERDKANVVMEPNFDIIIPEGDNYTYLCNMQKDPKDIILSSIFERDDIMQKCAANRFWIR